MNKDEQTLENELRINEEDMVNEWAQQPIKFIQVCRLCARTEAALAMAQLQSKEHEARLSTQFRTDGIEGVGRVTDDSVKAAVTNDQTTQQLRREAIEIQERLTVLEGLRKAYEMRERSLKYIQMSNSLPLQDEDRELVRDVARHALGN